MNESFVWTNMPTENATGIPMSSSLPKSPFALHQDVFNLYAIIVNAICTPIVAIFGLCLNGVGIFVLWNDLKFNKQSIYRYMLALMVFDNIYLIVGLILGTVSIINEFDFDLANILFMHGSYLTGYLDMVIYHASSAILVVMASERFKALVWPLAFKQSCLARYPWTIIISIFVLGILFASPFPLSFDVITINRGNKTILGIRRKEELIDFYDWYNLIETLVSGVYPIVMVFLNFAIPIAYCRVMNKRRALRSNNTQQDSQQLKVTIMVILIAMLYVLLSIPKLMLQTLFFMDNQYNFDGAYVQTFYFFTFTGDLFARINSANDFFIYVLVSRRYRNILYRIVMKYVACSKKYKNLNDIFRNANSDVIETEKQKSMTQISVVDGSEK